MKEINWGFIGCGEVTEKKSGPAFNEVVGSHVEAVMSRTEEKARSYAERHRIRKWYTDPNELVGDPEVNAVYIATPPSSHATFALMAMRAGKPVYIEKPLAASYEDCVRINRVSEQTGVPCFVAYYRRYLPYFRRVKEIVDSGVLGRIANVQIRATSIVLWAMLCPGDCNPTWPVVAISTIWLLISSTSFKISSALSPAHTVIVPIEHNSIRWRIR